MILGFLVVTSVLVVSLGRLGDIYGRVRMYNLGFAVFTFFSLLLSITWMTGTAAGIWLIVMRIFQGVGAAMLMANSAAILTDAFPPDRRGFALGINQAAAISGTFIGLLLGGLLAPINWRLIFLVSVPDRALRHRLGLLLAARGRASGSPARIDWAGNVTFAIGLILVMVGITYGIEPYGGHPMGWTNPRRPGRARRRRRLPDRCSASSRCTPTSRCSGCSSSRSAPSSAGVFASFLGALGRGGLMFMLIIWLQGIWLPRHGYTFAVTPLWAGHLHDPAHRGLPHRRPALGHPLGPLRPAALRHRRHARHRRLLRRSSSCCPIDFSYRGLRRAALRHRAVACRRSARSNRTGVMNSLPASDRGAGSGMNTTFQNSAQVLSIGIFFTLIIVGLSDHLPRRPGQRA